MSRSVRPSDGRSRRPTDTTVFKKALKIATTFGVLLAVLRRLRAALRDRGRSGPPRSRRHVALPVPTDVEDREGGDRAGRGGVRQGHWTADEDLQSATTTPTRLLDVCRELQAARSDGKQLRFEPFALIWQSRDGKELKTVTSDEAIDRPRPAVRPGEQAAAPSRCASCTPGSSGNVQLRDDKGTPATRRRPGHRPVDLRRVRRADPADPSDSDVVIQDRDMWITGFGLLIQLRPKDEAAHPAAAAAGFDGPRRAYPQEERPHRPQRRRPIGDPARHGQARAGQGRGQDARSTSAATAQMQVDLPKPAAPGRASAPRRPRRPTLAMFSPQRRGPPRQARPDPDQLNCDHLRLTLSPAESRPRRDPPAATAAKPRTRRPPSDRGATSTRTGAAARPTPPTQGLARRA